MTKKQPTKPAFELRCGIRLRLAIRLPAWLGAALAAAAGSALAAWITSR
ncbi:hypothetical protein [Streptomyces sp. NPDC048565]